MCNIKGYGSKFILICMICSIVSADTSCRIEGMPQTVPLVENQSVILNLQQYFLGNNITLSTPSSDSSYIDAQYSCQNLQQFIAGNVISFKYDQNIFTILAKAQSQIISYYIYYKIQNEWKQKQIPNTIIQCWDHYYNYINQSYSEIIVSCFKNTSSQQNTLMILSMPRQSQPFWITISNKFYLSNKKLPEKILLFFLENHNFLLKIIIDSTNSYIETWKWNNNRQIIAIYDRTFFSLTNLYIKSIQILQDTIFLLNYQTGIYQLKFFKIGTISLQKFYKLQYFTSFVYSNYDGGILFVANYGVVLQISVSEELILSVNKRYELVLYQNILQMEIIYPFLLILGNSQLNVININANIYKNSYMTYPVTSTYSIQISDKQSIYTLSSFSTIARISQCRINSPNLHLSIKNKNQNISIRIDGISKWNGESLLCSYDSLHLYFMQQPIKQQIFNIRSNFDQITYANRPGKALIPVNNFAMASNLTYNINILIDKIQFTYEIQKSVIKSCNISSSAIKHKIIRTYSYQNIILLQYELTLQIQHFRCYETLLSIHCSTIQVETKFLISSVIFITISTNDIIEGILFTNKNYNIIEIRKYQSLNPFKQHQLLCKISYQGLFESISNIQLSTNGQQIFLYILLPELKRIDIYQINKYVKQCKLISSLMHSTLKIKYFAPQSILIPSYGRLLIMQFNQLILIDVNIPNKYTLIYQYQLSKQSNIGLQMKQNKQYLVIIDSFQSTINLYSISNDKIPILLRNIPTFNRFNYSSRSSEDLILRDNWLIVRMIDNIQRNLYQIVVYDLSALSSPLMLFTQWLIDKDHYMIGLNLKQTTLQRILILSNEIQCICSRIIYSQPKIILDFPQKKQYDPDENKQIIQVIFQTLEDIIKIQFIIQLSNYQNQLSKGIEYPYYNYIIQARRNILIDTKNWFIGSITDFTYQCNDCEDRIKLYNKINKISLTSIPFKINLNTISYFQIISIDQYNDIIKQAIILQSNMFYQLNNYIPFNNIKSNQLTYNNVILINQLNLQCIIVKKDIFKTKLIFLCKKQLQQQLSNNMQVIIIIYTLTTFKNIEIARYTILVSKTNDNNIQLILDQPLIIIRIDSKVMIMILWYNTNSIQIILLLQIDQNTYNKQICYIESITKIINQQQQNNSNSYNLILTICKQGFNYLQYKIKYIQQQQINSNNIFLIPIIKIQFEQQIDIYNKLLNQKIQCPLESKIIFTLTEIYNNQKNKLQIYTIFNSFNSYSWIIQFNQNHIILSIILSCIYFKYNNYITISMSTLFNSSILIFKQYYIIQQQDIYQYFYVTYDRNQFILTSLFVRSYYIFQSLKISTSIINNTKSLSSECNNMFYILYGTQIRHYSIDNQIRGYIYNYSDLYTQYLTIIPYTNENAQSVTIKLHGLDIYSLSGWEILIIVVCSLLFAAGFIILSIYAFRRYQKYKKLVPLLEDYEEKKEQEQQEQEKEKEQRKRQQQRINEAIKHRLSDNINISIRQSNQLQ